jgi:hypothetical protein
MGAYLDLASMNAGLKEIYDNQTVENLVYADNPLMAMMPKKTDFGGKYKPIPIITGTSQGRSALFANAQGNQSPAQIESFLLTRTTDYAVASIDNQTMLASKTDQMAFLEGSKLLIDCQLQGLSNSIASAMFRTGTGSIGQITSITTGVIVLSNPGDIVQFEVNQVLQANSTDGGTPRAALGYVIAVNRSAGSFTVSATAMGGTAGSPTGWAAADFLLVQGDLNGKCSGLAGWLPTVAPTATDLFYGVNRFQDTWRLGGGRYNGSSQPIEEALYDASALGAREGAKPTDCVVPYTSFSALEKSMGGKVIYVDAKGPGDLFFRGIKVNGASSSFTVWADRSCQAQTAYLLDMKTWAIEGLGDVPQILKYGNDVNGDMLRISNADAGEVRMAAYYNVRTNAPGWNVNVQLSA